MKHSRKNDVDAPSGVRRVVSLTRGDSHAPITRLTSPADLGEILNPFVFLDLFAIDLHGKRSAFSVHLHCGIRTTGVARAMLLIQPRIGS